MSKQEGQTPPVVRRPWAVTTWIAKLGLAITAPLLLFGPLEGTFRLAGFGHNPDFLIPDRQPGVYRTNPRFTELFFPTSFGLKPLNLRLQKIKPAGRPYFLEHVHLTWEGNYTLARRLAGQACAMLFPANPIPNSWFGPSAWADAPGYTEVGRRVMLLQMEELTARALEYFSALVTRMPDSSGARLTYAHFLSMSGRESEAEEQWRAVLRLTPDNEEALEAMVSRLEARGPAAAAVALMLKAYGFNPHDVAHNPRLEEISEACGDLANTVKYLRAMADSGPVKPALHADLALDLLKTGRRDEAMVERQRARSAAEAEGDTALLRTVDDLIHQDELNAR